MAQWISNNFTGGVITNPFYSRFDLASYRDSARTIENYLVDSSGSVVRRGGSAYVGALKSDSSADAASTRLIPFTYSTGQSYAIELGEISGTGYARFYKDGARVGTVEHTNGASSNVIPWDGDDLEYVQYAQKHDLVYFACQKKDETDKTLYRPVKLSRVAADDAAAASWEWRGVTLYDGPYLPINQSSVTMTPGATSGNGVTVTASSATFVTTDDNTDYTIARHIRIGNADGEWGWARIVGFTSSTVVTVDIIKPFPSTSATTIWRLGAFSDTTGWPSAVAFHEQRLWFGRTLTQPNVVWSSEIGSYDYFTPSSLTDGTVRDSDGITASAASGTVDSIFWMVSYPRGLLVLTDSSEYLLKGADAVLSPSTVTMLRVGSVGTSDRTQPVAGNDSAFFVSKDRRRVYRTRYDIENDSLRSVNITLPAERLFRSQLTRLAFQNNPFSLLWAHNENGSLYTYTYDPVEKVGAWAQQRISGTWDDGTSDLPDAASPTILLDTDGYEYVYTIVTRTVNATTRRYIERISTKTDVRYATQENLEQAVYLDGAWVYSGASVTTLTGGTHLIGQSVTVHYYGNGGWQAETRTVNGSGEVTTSYATDYAVIGLPYTSDLVSLPPLVVDNRIVATFSVRPTRVKLHLNESRGGSIGSYYTSGQGGHARAIHYQTQPNLESGTNVYSGYFEQAIEARLGDETPGVRVYTSAPYPLTVCALLVTTDVGGV